MQWNTEVRALTVRAGTPEALAALLRPIASYTDSNNANGVPNYAAISGAATADPPTLTVVAAPTSSG